MLGRSRGAALAGLAPRIALAQRVADLPDPTDDLYPAKRNEKYVLDRPITDEKVNGNYNNFYEFGSSKNVTKAAQALKIRPWTVKIDGMVEKPFEVGIDDLVRKMPIEERLYRHRCVEAWSMAVPWSGFPMAKLVELAKPLSSAKYVRMETFLDKSIAPGQQQSWHPWPYVEGLTIAEATNELTFLATGAYGKPMPKQHGAPMRLAVPWKYGFKSHQVDRARSFTDKRPKSYWEELQASRIRLLGERQSGGRASALEPGDRRADRHRRAPADAAVQRLRRISSPISTRDSRASGCGRDARAERVTAIPMAIDANKKPGSFGPGSVCRRGTADTHLPEGNKLPAPDWLNLGGCDNPAPTANEIMRRRLFAHNAKRRMSAMRRGQKRWEA